MWQKVEQTNRQRGGDPAAEGNKGYAEKKNPIELPVDVSSDIFAPVHWVVEF